MQKAFLLLFLFLFPSSNVSTRTATPEKKVATSVPAPQKMDGEQLFEDMQLGGVVNFLAFRQAVAGYNLIKQKSKSILTLIDFTKPSTEKRLFVFDMEQKKMLYSSVVSHGKNSGENVQRILYSRSGCFMCDKTDYDNIFKGIVRCADCGRTMLVKVEHRRKRNSVLDQTFYCCSTYRKYGAKACDSHNLEARVLHEAVFADIQAHAKAAVSNREALVKKIANQMHLRVSSDRAQHKRDLKQCKARIAEIEDLYAKLYEDVSKGLLPEKRFQMLADRYDKEQAELTEKIEQYEREGRAEHDQLDKIQDFIDEVSKYAGITELNYKILHQLIDKILVSKAEKVDGEYVQKIQIFYRFIGPLDAIE
jgi:hypothetical protein